ncbi:DegT/DnrJ/EryC1/StrS family aminotransferase [bacterium]|nr:DegT/DnrJ/EryC1/StrS family aminotransferase [candidate division CSSED10-310 bacterium]
MNVPLLDIKRQLEPIRDQIDAALRSVVDDTQFILGPQVADLEKAVGVYCGSAKAIGVASGTDALIIALMAMGIGRGDEVITTPYSFFASASSIWRIGARPVFADIDPGTFNIDPCEVEKVLSPKTKAILCVHLFGQTADMDSLNQAAGTVPVIEDAAQAMGAAWRGIRAGNLGEIGCFSFFPSKNLGGFGDGGMITTSSTHLAEKCRALRVHGALKTYIHEDVGLNSRLDSIQAAVLKVKLPYLDGWCERRRQNAAYYGRMFANTPVGTPRILEHATPIFNQYVVRIPRRELLRKRFAELGIGHAVYYPLPLHLQPCFRDLGYRKGDFPVSEQASDETIALPIFSELTDTELHFVAKTVLEHVASFS